MCDNDATEGASKIFSSIARDQWEVRISTLIQISHMHATIKHYSLAVYSHHHAAFSHFLPCPWSSSQKPNSDYIHPRNYITSITIKGHFFPHWHFIKWVPYKRYNNAKSHFSHDCRMNQIPKTRHSIAILGGFILALATPAEFGKTSKQNAKTNQSLDLKPPIGKPGWIWNS